MPIGVYVHKNGYHLTEEHKAALRISMNGRHPSQKAVDARNKFMNSQEGKELAIRNVQKAIASNIGKKREPGVTEKCRQSNILRFKNPELRKKASEVRLGEKGSNWKGGLTQEQKRIRNSIEFRLWREAIFSRDNWTCQECGARGKKIHPHHIKAFSKYPDLRFAIDNGITLCIHCHMNLHGLLKKEVTNVR